MLTEERFNAILSLLEGKKAVTVQELSSLLNISESTVRRDLNALSEQGRLNKVHGGATFKNNDNGVISTEEDIRTKSTHYMAEKELIAKYASTLIRNDDFVFIDAGTTTEKLINFIPSTSKATFVTSGMSKLSRSERKIVTKILSIITDIAPKDIATQIIEKIKEEMR